MIKSIFNKKNMIEVFKTLVIYFLILLSLLLIVSIVKIGFDETLKFNFLIKENGVLRIRYILLAAILLIILELMVKSEKNKEKIDKIFWMILVLTLLGIFFGFLIGEEYYIYDDFGSDTKNQYFPYYVNEVLNIKDGMFSSWNFHYGLGDSTLSMNAWTFDIFSIILVIISILGGRCTFSSISFSMDANFKNNCSFYFKQKILVIFFEK